MLTLLMTWDEPIPDFVTRYPNVLESCLSQPFQTFNKKQLYVGIHKQAAILFYLLIKNHPFQNGNKRIAVTSLLIFLSRNKRWLKVDNQELYQFAVWVAESPSPLKKHAVEAIQTFLKLHIILG